MSQTLHQFADQLAEHRAEVFTRPTFLWVLENACINATSSQKERTVTISLHFDKLDPLAVLEQLSSHDEPRFYWEKPELDLAISASGFVHEIVAKGEGRFKQVEHEMAYYHEHHDAYSVLTHSLTGLHFLGGFSFFDSETDGDWANFGTARFIIPKWIIVRDGNLSLLTIAHTVKPGTNPKQVLDEIVSSLNTIIEKLAVYRNPSFSDQQSKEALAYQVLDQANERLHWNDIVAKATSEIKHGTYNKIVLARTRNIIADRTIVETRLLHHLRREYPNCYSFLLQFANTASFVGSTPERLISIQSGFLNTDGLAGSIPRGQSATDDTILEKRLLMSDKDQEEHRFVVESIVARLKEFTTDIHRASEAGIRKFTNVQHLYTPISARLPMGTKPLAIVETLHPTPAVGGVPRDAALDGILELEGFRRGWYAGPIGWMNTNGRAEFSVAIRSGLIKGDRATFYAGCGIVEGSDPASEWNETEIKFIPMMTALRHA
jgi:menaquinone-specific isochorismate synthase